MTSTFKEGRKWTAFILMLATVLFMVAMRWLTDEKIISTLLLGLLAIYGGGNLGAKWVTKGEPLPQTTLGPMREASEIKP